MDQLVKALIHLGRRNVQSRLVLPPNPTVSERLTALCNDIAAIDLVPPLSHAAIIEAMREADLLLSDSGGMQEEAPSLGVPLLVLREKTERPEALATDNCRLVGTDAENIIEMVELLRNDRTELRSMSKPSMPFGDGKASPRIVRHCLAFLANRIALAESYRA